MKKKRCFYVLVNFDDFKECKYFISRLFFKYINLFELNDFDIIFYVRYYVVNT